MKLIFCVTTIIIFGLISCNNRVNNAKQSPNTPEIFPDYTSINIPPNIAPLNFKLVKKTDALQVEFTGNNFSFKVTGEGKIDIPMEKWKKLLELSKGRSVSVVVYSRLENEWTKYQPFNIEISDFEIDPYLAYRLIAPGYETWSKMGIYQRDLTSFKQTPIVENSLVPGSCVNCHSFKQNDPNTMMFHFRSPKGGTILWKDGELSKLETQTQQTLSKCVYPYWHPSGNYIAYSVNKIAQAFHAVSEKRIEVIDSESDLVIYDIKKNELLTCNAISTSSNFETFPSFSSDGKQLIFCSAKAKKIPEEYDQIRYNLNSIAFNASNGTFGTTVSTLVDADSLGKSISFPRVSPSGKFLMYTMASYGNFSIWHKDADLYLLDLETYKSTPLNAVNSKDTDSYHSWSSNSRWFVFSSRRLDGLYTRPFIASIDENGNTGKPFLLPQKDPDFYTYLLESFNIPELITSNVNLSHSDIENMVNNSPAKQVVFKKK